MQWHQLGHMQVCTSLQTDNHASTPPLSFLQAADALPAAQPTASKHSSFATAVNCRWSAACRAGSSKACWCWSVIAHLLPPTGRQPSWCPAASCSACVPLAATTRHVTSGVTSLPPTFDQSARAVTGSRMSGLPMVLFNQIIYYVYFVFIFKGRPSMFVSR